MVARHAPGPTPLFSRNASPEPSWYSFLSLLRGAAEGQGEVGCSIAVLRADLLDLAELSSRFGPAAAGDLQQRIEQRLDALCGLSGRWYEAAEGRYALFMANIGTRAAVARFAARLAAALSRPIMVGGSQIRAACCVGSSLMARPNSGDEALRRAEMALAEARRGGPGSQCLYGEALDARVRGRAELLQALQQGVANQEFRLHYQPVVSLDTGRLVSAEALLRWLHPANGLQSPEGFLSLAEESGLIVKLGGQVLDMALRQARHWAGMGHAAMRIGVNVSGAQLKRPGFPELVRRTLAETGASPQWLELELSETTLLECPADTIRQLMTLRAAGVSLAVDDFGAGYASLRFLRDLPVTRLKIDREFVRNIATDTRDASIFSAITGMAANLGLDVVAKGVETEAQAEMLRASGCRSAQGWLFGRAMPAGPFGQLLDAPGPQTGARAGQAAAFVA